MSLQTRLASLITAIGVDIKKLQFGQTYMAVPGGVDVQAGILTVNDYDRAVITSQADRRVSIDLGRGAFRFATAEYDNIPSAGASTWGNDYVVPERTSSIATLIFPAPTAGKDRIDTVIAVLDPLTMNQTVMRVAGTEQTAGVPTLVNRTGAPSAAVLTSAAGGVSLSTRFIVLYDVLCKAANSTLVSADVGDRRQYADPTTQLRLSALPLNPWDGQIINFSADATNGVVWTFRYWAGSPSAYKWEFIGGTSLFSEVVTSESTTSTTYANLTTTGPSITVPLAGDYQVEIAASNYNNGVNSNLMSYSIGGTAASDSDAWKIDFATANKAQVGARSRLKTGLAAATALVAKYRVSGGAGAYGDVSGNRIMRVTPVRVG